jgi:hypothetical protein
MATEPAPHRGEDSKIPAAKSYRPAARQRFAVMSTRHDDITEAHRHDLGGLEDFNVVGMAEERAAARSVEQPSARLSRAIGETLQWFDVEDHCPDGQSAGSACRLRDSPFWPEKLLQTGGRTPGRAGQPPQLVRCLPTVLVLAKHSAPRRTS